MGIRVFWGFWENFWGFFAVFGPFSIDVRPSCFGPFGQKGLDIGALFSFWGHFGGGGGLFSKKGSFWLLFGFLVKMVKKHKAVATFLGFLAFCHFWPKWLTAIKSSFWPSPPLFFSNFEKSRGGDWEKSDLIDRRPFLGPGQKVRVSLGFLGFLFLLEYFRCFGQLQKIGGRGFWVNMLTRGHFVIFR